MAGRLKALDTERGRADSGTSTKDGQRTEYEDIAVQLRVRSGEYRKAHCRNPYRTHQTGHRIGGLLWARDKNERTWSAQDLRRILFQGEPGLGQGQGAAVRRMLAFYQEADIRHRKGEAGCGAPSVHQRFLRQHRQAAGVAEGEPGEDRADAACGIHVHR